MENKNIRDIMYSVNKTVFSSTFFGFTALLYKSNMSQTEDTWLGIMRQAGKQLNSLSTCFFFKVILKFLCSLKLMCHFEIQDHHRCLCLGLIHIVK